MKAGGQLGFGELDRVAAHAAGGLRGRDEDGAARATLRRAGFEEHSSPVVANQPIATVLTRWRGQV